MSRMIPQSMSPDIKSNAEKKIFRLLRDAPGTQDWIVLHSLGLARHDVKRRGEIDFVILCNKGIIVLEVKGGRVRRENGIWTTQNKYGNYIRLHESPYEQASTTMFALEKNIRKKFGSNHPLGKLIFCYGIIFPRVC